MPKKQPFSNKNPKIPNQKFEWVTPNGKVQISSLQIKPVNSTKPVNDHKNKLKEG
ncbi:MAG: hypothetical protein IJJ40_00860 [Clostridia bacterium]|nr:hypothetical protein [Clostridia bacterium]